MVQQELHQSHNGKSEVSYPFGQPPDEVRVLMIGDRGVGKTSIIHSLVEGEFETNLPAKMSDVTLSAELTSESIPMRIVDYSERDQPEEFAKSVLEANVICIVYSANDAKSFDNVATHWIPTVKSCQTMLNNNSNNNYAHNGSEDQISFTYRPIILVENKIDLLNENRLSEKVTMVVKKHPEIEAYIRVSVLNQENVVELFTIAQKAVAYPLAPLFDHQARTLTKECRSALIEIFKLCDMDGDNLLSDHELNVFQENCFGVPLQKDALDDLKLIIQQSTTDGILDDSMTQAGFLFLHALSIEKGRHDFTWQVLRKFNHHDNEIDIKTTDYYGDQSTVLVGDLSNRRCSLISNEGQNLIDSTLSPASSPLSSTSKSSLGSNNQISIQHLNLNWLKEHSNLIKTGVGVTIATLASMLALKLVIQSGTRS